MKKIFTLLLLCSAWLSNAQNNAFLIETTSPLGWWEFESAGMLDAKAGYAGGSLTTATPAQFTQVAGPEGTDGAVLYTKGTGIGEYLRCAHSAAANGGGTRVNKWTMLFDIKVSSNSWNCILNTDNAGTSDGELFFRSNASYGSGSLFGFYSGSYAVDTWYRVVVTMDLTKPAGDYTSANWYMDGVLKFGGNWDGGTSLDNLRRSLDTAGFLIFGDEDGEQATTSTLAQFVFWDRELSAAEIAGFGGTTLATAKFSAADTTLKVYPNPVSSTARISFTMPSASKNANIELIDMTGRVVENIYRGSLDQGEQTISWDLKSKYNAGTYLVKLSSENTNQVYSILMK